MPSRRSNRARKSSRRFSRHRLSRPSSRHMSSRLSSSQSPRHAARAAPGRASNGRIAARLMSLPTTSEGMFSENDSRHAVQEQGITASGRWLKAASSSKSMLRATSSMRRSIPVKQMTAARLIPRSAAHGGDNGVPRGLPLPDWFWASVTASTLAHATGEPVNITAPDGTAAGYRELIQATSRASYLRLAQQFGGNAEQIRQVLTTPMTSDDMQQVMVTQNATLGGSSSGGVDVEALDDEVADTEQPPPSSTAQQEATAQPLGPQDDAHRATQPAEGNGTADAAQEVVVSSRRPVTQETRIASRPTHDDLDVDAVSVVSEDSVLTTVDPAGAKLEWTHWRQELLDPAGAKLEWTHWRQEL